MSYLTLTASSLVPHRAGIALGLLYALAWLLVAYTAAGRNDRLRGGFAGVLAPLLAFPLISEAALRFHVWDATGALLMLAAVTAGGC